MKGNPDDTGSIKNTSSEEAKLDLEMQDFNDHIQRSVTNDPENNIMTRLATLSKTLSSKNANDMETFQLDKDDFNLESILNYIVKFNKDNGYDMNEIDVVFQDLTVTGKNTAASVLKDVTDVFFKPFAMIYNRIQNKKNNNAHSLKELPKTRKIIRNVTGFIAPGTLTLVLGRPGAGCSTLLKTIAGEAHTYKGIDGNLSYNGIDKDIMSKYMNNLLVYNPELDVHFAYLTVEQTLNFAITCKTPNIRYDNKTRKEYIENMKDLQEILFGLKHVEKTLVGNDFVRGISGGQRKRVSIAEAMVTSANVYCYDNATRGLDSSTALEFVQALRTSTNIYKNSSIVTIYQASENIYELFDYVTVMYLGRQIYFGPTNEGVAYFENLGFLKHPRETSSEFLTAITDPNARKINPEFHDISIIPSTADEFEALWRNSKEFFQLQNQIDEKLRKYTGGDDPLQRLKENEKLIKQKHTSKRSVYTVNYLTQLKACCKRKWEIILNDRSYPITLVGASTVQALVMGSLAYNTTYSTVGAFSRGGALFFSCFYFAIMALAETPSLFLDKPILNKQYGYKLYHPSAELLAKQLVQFPIQLAAIVIFAIVIYFLVDLKREAGAFFQYLVIVILIVQAIYSLFALLSALMPNESAAMGICGITMMSMVIYSSYMIQRPSMYWWFKWFSYCNPILYAFEALITMQFHHLEMPCTPFQLIPNGPSYQNIDPRINQVCGFVGAAASKQIYNGRNDVNGDVYLELAFTYSFSHAWRNFGILFAFIFGYIIIACISVEIFNPIIPSSDKLLFVKNAKITNKMFEHFRSIAAEEDNNIDVEKIGDDGLSKAETMLSTSSSEDHKLGSNDIFTWQHIDYSVLYEKEQRKLLDDVQGYVIPGTLTALMGESGAGKTTLLNVLSRRTDVGFVTGDMLINGQPMGSSFERRTGYVQQQDIHIAELTVKESLLFSARLRRPRSVPDEEKIEYVEMIMRILDMEDYADSIAGISGYGLNVEQRKKLSIATELVAKPSLLLFLDEPTSGLDSQSSWAIVQVLKDLAKAGQAILCTIHQPSATLFEQFDRLLLLKKGGQTVYFGDIGTDSRTVIDYFESHGGRVCDKSENPAEYILEVIGAGATASVTDDWFEIWNSSDEYSNTTKEVADLVQKGSSVAQPDDEDLSSKYATSYPYQFYQVLNRTFTQMYRSLPYIMPKLGLTTLGGLLVGFSFWDIKYTVIGMQNVMFANFLTIVISAPLMNQIQTQAISSRELFEVRESKSNTFHWSCLLLSQYLNELPYCIVFGTIYFICWYFPVQLNYDAKHAGFWWFNYAFFFQLFYPSFALMVLYPSPDLPTANILLGLLFSFCIAFCGVFQRPMLMPGFWKFMWRVSPLTYFVSNQLAISLHDRPVVCSEEEYNYLEPLENMTCGEYLEQYFQTNTGYVNNPNSTTNCQVCQYNIGDQFLESIGISYGDRWRNIGFFCAYIGFNLCIMVTGYYIFRVRKTSPKGFITSIKSKFSKK